MMQQLPPIPEETPEQQQSSKPKNPFDHFLVQPEVLRLGPTMEVQGVGVNTTERTIKRRPLCSFLHDA